MTPVLIFDRPKPGHFRRGVEVIAKALLGEPLIDSLPRAWPRLLGWRGAVVFQTADDYLLPFLGLALIRSLLGRRSVAILTRNPSGAGSWKLHLRVLLISAARRMPGVSALANIAPAGPDSEPGNWVFDTEWWDLQVAPLDACAVTLPDAPVLLAIGAVGRHKGLEFFLAAAEQARDIRFVLVGDVTKVASADMARFRAAGGTVLPPPSDDGMFVSYIRNADWIWCCYHPHSNKSSGIFGRCLQLGKPGIVRRGSYLEPFQMRYGRGCAVEFGNVEALLTQLANPPPTRMSATQLPFLAASVPRIRAACGLMDR